MDRAAIQERFGILGTSPALQRVLDRLRLVARTDASVLLQGESGSGKELLAQALHALSNRRHKAFVVVNCGAIPEGLIESELFGAEKGAYTGSVERRTGFFEEANGGTIFLDEIGELPLQAQVRLLRVLENGSYSRVGSAQERKADARVVAATNRDLAREVASGRFREDLYYRLSTVVVDVPPLRDRREDVVPLFEHFLRVAADRYNAGRRTLDDGARRLVGTYNWPGNVRELRNVAEQAVVLVTGPVLTADALQPLLRGVSASTGLVPVARPGAEGFGGANGAAPEEARERELLYRALLELRLDVRDLRRQLDALLTAVQAAEADLDAACPAPRGEGFVIVRGEPSAPGLPARPAPRGDESDDVEDAPYELAGAARPAPPPPPPDPLGDEDAVPRLDDVERTLIARALRTFDGNRRRAAQALGISERTLYRKLNELEAQGVQL